MTPTCKPNKYQTMIILITTVLIRTCTQNHISTRTKIIPLWIIQSKFRQKFNMVKYEGKSSHTLNSKETSEYLLNREKLVSVRPPRQYKVILKLKGLLRLRGRCTMIGKPVVENTSRPVVRTEKFSRKNT